MRPCGGEPSEIRCAGAHLCARSETDGGTETLAGRNRSAVEHPARGFQASCRARLVTPQVLVSVRLKASPARAFEIFTRDIALWWTPNALFRFTPRSPGTLAFEPHESGRFTETLANGTVFEIGRIREWEPGERLVFSWRQATFGRVRRPRSRSPSRPSAQRRGSRSSIAAGTACRTSMLPVTASLTRSSCAGTVNGGRFCSRGCANTARNLPRAVPEARCRVLRPEEGRCALIRSLGTQSPEPAVQGFEPSRREHGRTLGIFWVTRTGAPWRDLPEELGKWNTIYRQFRRWSLSGF